MTNERDVFSSFPVSGNRDRLTFELCERRSPFKFLETAVVALVGPNLNLLRRGSR